MRILVYLGKEKLVCVDMFTILPQLKCNEFPKAILLLPEKIVRFNMYKGVGTNVNKN
jgi:hypothetical protein